MQLKIQRLLHDSASNMLFSKPIKVNSEKENKANKRNPRGISTDWARKVLDHNPGHYHPALEPGYRIP
ncbi:hypothetical protein M501DRAFT_1004527 [Patellaria atrata CBS 101060]|uniref:Uncharacterized protein n=1 Tax=Patellaria atrata CBS 101060 TaxID=1346257 RepID=A0A9P4SBC6_9PEZI|nr:hypothetical protein M501DRAFT_1004527 [Patellaria atrata CBS 101060]